MDATYLVLVVRTQWPHDLEERRQISSAGIGSMQHLFSKLTNDLLECII